MIIYKFDLFDSVTHIAYGILAVWLELLLVEKISVMICLTPYIIYIFYLFNNDIETRL